MSVEFGYIILPQYGNSFVQFSSATVKIWLETKITATTTKFIVYDQFLVEKRKSSYVFVFAFFNMKYSVKNCVFYTEPVCGRLYKDKSFLANKSNESQNYARVPIFPLLFALFAILFYACVIKIIDLLYIFSRASIVIISVLNNSTHLVP